MKKEVLVFKVGGGVICSPEAFSLFVLDVFRKITKKENDDAIIILTISAFGKMTEMIKEIVAMLEHGDEITVDLKIHEIAKYLEWIVGREIVHTDFPEGRRYLNFFRNKALLYRSSAISDEMNAELQQFGELISSKIMEDMLRSLSSHKKWDYVRFLDACDFIRTTGSLLSGEVDAQRTKELFSGHITPIIFSEKGSMVICPGYIARSIDGKPALLGKEGSDYTAALITILVSEIEAVRSVEITYFKNFSGISLDYQDDQSKIEPVITWNKVEKLAIDGARVLHLGAIRSLKEKNICATVVSMENFLKNGESTIIHY